MNAEMLFHHLRLRYTHVGEWRYVVYTHIILNQGGVIPEGCVHQTSHLVVQVQRVVTTGLGECRDGGGKGEGEGEGGGGGGVTNS